MSRSEPRIEHDTWRDRLRQAIDLTPWKHSAIAEAAGINPATLSRILTGRMPHPSFEIIVRLARVAHVRVGDLLGERSVELTETEADTVRRAREILKAVADASG